MGEGKGGKAVYKGEREGGRKMMRKARNTYMFT